MKSISEKDKITLVRLALKYSPVTRALLGAILEDLQESSITEPLYKSLNPITKYKLKGVAKVFRNVAKWNIV